MYRVIVIFVIVLVTTSTGQLYSIANMMQLVYMLLSNKIMYATVTYYLIFIFLIQFAKVWKFRIISNLVHQEMSTTAYVEEFVSPLQLMELPQRAASEQTCDYRNSL